MIYGPFNARKYINTETTARKKVGLDMGNREILKKIQNFGTCTIFLMKSKISKTHHTEIQFCVRQEPQNSIMDPKEKQ